MKTASQAIAIGTLLALGADRVAAEGGEAPEAYRPRIITTTDLGATPTTNNPWFVCWFVPTSSISKD